MNLTRPLTSCALLLLSLATALGSVSTFANPVAVREAIFEKEKMIHHQNGSELYKIKSLLGKGAFGPVFEVEVLSGPLAGQTQAIKFLPLSADYVDHSRMLYSGLNSDGIFDRVRNIHPVGEVEDVRFKGRPLHIVRSEVASTSVYDASANFNALTEATMPTANGVQGIRNSAILVLQLMEFHADMVETGWVHGDLKAANILIKGSALDIGKGEFQSMVTDWDGAVRANKVGMPHTTIVNSAPEILLSSEGKFISALADVYSTGVLVFEGLMGVNPMQDFLFSKSAVNRITFDLRLRQLAGDPMRQVRFQKYIAEAFTNLRSKFPTETRSLALIETFCSTAMTVNPWDRLNAIAENYRGTEFGDSFRNSDLLANLGERREQLELNERSSLEANAERLIELAKGSRGKGTEAWFGEAFLEVKKQLEKRSKQVSKEEKNSKSWLQQGKLAAIGSEIEHQKANLNLAGQRAISNHRFRLNSANRSDGKQSAELRTFDSLASTTAFVAAGGKSDQSGVQARSERGGHNHLDLNASPCERLAKALPPNVRP